MARATLQLIDRGDLIAALERASAKAVTIISAPAGSGKTSLLRSWAGQPGQHHRLAAVQVERGQQDAQQFWLSLLGAIRQAAGSAAGAEPPAAAPEFNEPAIADRVLSELACANGGLTDITLVIDDLHELHAPGALSQLTRLLMNLPPHAHAILATRRDLPLHLHQLRLAGELAEIRAADLRFTGREPREPLAASGITLSEDGVGRLHQRTEGWAAGLRLATISLAGHGDPERFVAEFSGSDRTVAEYLIAEMLERQPDDVQQLLLRTSLLDQMNGGLADLLAGRPGAERILLELEDANAFVVSLDPGRTWFRYHHLFGDLLRLELRRTLPEQVIPLHRQAAEWLLQHGRVTDAIRHTQAAGDWPEAARLLADHSFGLTLDGQAQTVQALACSFPPGKEQAELALVRAMGAYIQGRLDEAPAHLALAEAHARTMPPDRQRRLGLAIAAVRLSLARRHGHLASVLEQAEHLTAAVTGQSEEHIALESDLRALALLNLGTAQAWAPGASDAQRHLREGAELARKIGRPYLEVGCLAQLGFASATDRIPITQARCREAIALAERYGWGSEWVIAPALVTLAAAVIWTGDLDQGERWLQRAGQAPQAGSGPDIRLLLHIVSGMLQAGRGRLPEALEEFGAAERLRGQWMGSHALANRPGEARAALAALDHERASSGEIGSAATDILDVMNGTARAGAGQQPPPPGEPLSRGELRVLRYLPTNLSRPEIATQLSVSLNTVSTQIRSIYAKLRVSDRTSAVQRARELRLLSAGRLP